LRAGQFHVFVLFNDLRDEKENPIVPTCRSFIDFAGREKHRKWHKVAWNLEEAAQAHARRAVVHR